MDAACRSAVSVADDHPTQPITYSSSTPGHLPGTRRGGTPGGTWKKRFWRAVLSYYLASQHQHWHVCEQLINRMRCVACKQVTQAAPATPTGDFAAWLVGMNICSHDASERTARDAKSAAEIHIMPNTYGVAQGSEEVLFCRRCAGSDSRIHSAEAHGD